MVDFVLVGDLHINGLDSLFPNLSSDPNDMIYQALDNVISYAQENSIENIIFCGDIYHNPNPSQESQKRFLKYISTIPLKFWAIGGNHDYTLEGENSLVMSEFTADISKINIKFFTGDPVIQTIDGVDFCFMPWPHSKSLGRGRIINIAHIPVLGSRSDSGKLLKEGVKVDTSQYWYIGDLHTHHRVGKNICYVGMLYQRTFGEQLPKGFIHLQVDTSKGKFKVEDEFVIIKPPYELVNLRIDTLDDFKKLSYDKHEVVQYKLKMHGDVAIPTNLRLDYPNIVDIDWGKNKKKIKTDSGQIISLKGLSDPLDGLSEFLRREGLNDKEIARGIKKAQMYLEEIV